MPASAKSKLCKHWTLTIITPSNTIFNTICPLPRTINTLTNINGHFYIKVNHATPTIITFIYIKPIYTLMTTPCKAESLKHVDKNFKRKETESSPWILFNPYTFCNLMFWILRDQIKGLHHHQFAKYKD